MNTKPATTLRIREFTRREKTCIRQDVKRFEKIGRDHRCDSLEDYAHFVRERMKYSDTGEFTIKSLTLVRGLIAYVGDQLKRETNLERVMTTLELAPGWLLRDPDTFQTVFVGDVVIEYLITNDFWAPTLDEIIDELIDWNYGYLETEDLHTRHVWDPDTGLGAYLAA